jgi:4-amino-4-deoxy-L-arabinose transferase-like glycosyltransferase
VENSESSVGPIRAAAAASALPAEDTPPGAVLPPCRRRFLSRLLGHQQSPAWVRFAVLAIVLGTGILYTWSLETVGYGNAYYAAAAASGAVSWKAWFFGSLDSASFITVDKPPASLWLMGLSVRLFGLSTWSILLPQVLAGMATVYILYRTVRRWMGAPAGLMAAGALALTPVAVVMFRYDNPDALLVLLAVSALAMGFRAVESGRLRWLLGAFALTGLAFLTKTTQALLVVPALTVTYLVAAPGRFRRRLAHIGLGLVVLVAAAGWWIAAVQLTPAADRPYVGGTKTDSVLEYALFGYNGVDRLTGESGTGPGGGFGGSAGWTRVFNDEVGGQISWLLPAAAIGLGAGLWASRRGRRTDLKRAGWILWGTSFVTQMAIFSFISGILHPYYTLTLAPVLGALVGAGTVTLWRAYRLGGAGALLLPASIALTAVWAFALLDRTPGFAPGLGTAVLAVALAAAGILLLLRALRPAGAISLVAAVVGLATLLAGPAAYALDTVGQATAGGNPTAGPTVTSTALGLTGPTPQAALDADAPVVQNSAVVAPGPAAENRALSEGLLTYLEEQRGDATWLAATEGSQTAASIILATRQPVMAMGGFNGGDPAPTVAELEDYVSTGQLRFVLLLGNGTAIGPQGQAQDGSQYLPQDQYRPQDDIRYRPEGAPQYGTYLPGGGPADAPDRPQADQASGGQAPFPGAGAGGGQGLTTQRTTWVEQNCSLVDPSEYGGGNAAVSLYDCAP